MPIGDPQGGLFEYTVEGFYTGMLGMELLGRDGREAYLKRGECRIILTVSDRVGVDTGIRFGVDSPFNTRRRLIDEEVEFVREPVHTPFGTCTSFLDPDGNVLHAIDSSADFRM